VPNCMFHMSIGCLEDIGLDIVFVRSHIADIWTYRACLMAVY